MKQLQLSEKPFQKSEKPFQKSENLFLPKNQQQQPENKPPSVSEEIKAHENSDGHENSDDWMYRPILKTNTKCNYDGNQIEFENMLEYE